jgi:hypothetical protein
MQVDLEEARQSSLGSFGELNVAQTKLRQSEKALEATRAELAEQSAETRRVRAELKADVSRLERALESGALRVRRGGAQAPPRRARGPHTTSSRRPRPSASGTRCRHAWRPTSTARRDTSR